MKSNPKVSVIIPIYNASKYLNQLLASITDQTFQNIEILCIDNGSTDDSLDIIRKHAKSDSRIITVTTPNSNAGKARNEGLMRATGDYLLFIDADDFCEPTMIEKAYSAAQKEQADIVVFQFYTYDDKTHTRLDTISGIEVSTQKRTFSPDEIKSHIFGAFKNCPWNKLFNANFIKKNGLLFQEIPRGNDIFFSYMALALCEKITLVKEPLINYRINNKDSLQNNNQITPISFLDGFRSVSKELHTINCYHKYQQSFLTELLNNAIYNLDKMLPKTNAYYYLFYTIKYGLEIEFQISKIPPNLLNQDSYSRYKSIVDEPSVDDQVKAAVNLVVSEIKSSKSYKIGATITAIPKELNKILKGKK